MKQFATYFTHGVRQGARLRADVYHCHQAPAILELVDRFFEGNSLDSSADAEHAVA